MKLNFKTEARDQELEAGNLASTVRRESSQRGIALVITLILLSVTLVMALAFLAISRRGRSAVTTSVDTTVARLAADNALAQAQGQIIATIYATTNAYNYGLLVSTNYINTNGFVANISDPTNVNYFYGNGNPLNSTLDFEQNVANLLFLPRAPVFVPTNSIGSNEFRFYLDLNRDGHFEDTRGDVPNVDNFGVTNGMLPEIGDPQWVGVLERPDVTHGPNNHFVSRYAFVAMPADNALDLNAIYNQAITRTVDPAAGGSDGYFRNQGVGTWEINLAAFLADLNTNEWDTTTAGYKYQEALTPAFANSGFAFQDALSLLSFRYDFDYDSLASLQALLGTQGYNAYQFGAIDSYSAGNLMTNTQLPFLKIQNSATPWAGADNTNHYFDVASDLFDKTKTQRNVISPTFGFTDRLLNAGTNNLGGNTVPTYNRYTFYRLLAQLGTDSAPEQNKLNLNYSNAAAYYNANGVLTGTAIFANAETNLVPWRPIDFFTIAADRMLREYTARWFRADPTNYLRSFYAINPTYYVNGSGFGVTNVSGWLTNQVPAFGITNIPVLMDGQFVYSPAVQRVLQLAANMFDATTNRAFLFGKDYPSVFRPVFFKSVSPSGVSNVWIVSFQDVATYYEQAGGVTAGSSVLDLPQDVNSLPVNNFTPPNPSPNLASVNQLKGNVYGVPWIIGAKKGFPSFNEFSMESVVQVTRKLQLTRTNSSAASFGGGLPMKVVSTNQMYVFGITNYLGVELWNSSSNGYVGNLQVVVRDNLLVALTNGVISTSTNYTISAITNFTIWSGWTNSVPKPGAVSSFVLPLGLHGTNLNFLPASVYRFGAPSFVDVGLNPQFESYPPTVLPQFGLLMTNRLQVFILDNGHVIDYVHFNGPDSATNLNNELADPDASGGPQAYLWSTNLSGTVPWGVINQINVSSGAATLVMPSDGGNWNSPPGLPPALRAYNGNNSATKAYFNGFLVPNSLYSFRFPNGDTKTYTNMEYSVQAPYTATRTIVNYTSWQANDPLVHYLATDLNFYGSEPSTALRTGTTVTEWSAAAPPILPDLNLVNQRYQPWGIAFSDAGADNNPFNTAYKDPGVRYSDRWAFPTDKLPTVGWLGRVHRGTPWQTVYLKASNVLKATNGFTTWSRWTSYNDPDNVTNTAPIQDRALFDIFTTALNDNATRGQMSVNLGANGQPSLAGWSALLSGIAVPTSLTNTYRIISPAGGNGTNSMLYQMVNNINTTRAAFTNADGVVGAFERIGDVLSASALSEKSPFLTGLNTTNQISDALEEWLPQQTLSLLRVSSAPRYIIYSYGQTLKPAADGVVTSGPFFGMVTNYQVVAETATRAVLQVQPVITTNLDGTVNTNFNTKIEQFNILPPQ